MNPILMMSYGVPQVTNHLIHHLH